MNNTEKNIQVNDTQNTEINRGYSSYNPDYTGNQPNYSSTNMYPPNMGISNVPVAYPHMTPPLQSGIVSSGSQDLNYQIPPINLYISMDKIKTRRTGNNTNSEDTNTRNQVHENNQIDDTLIKTNHNYSLREFPIEDRKALIDFGIYLGINLKKYKFCIKYVLEAYNAPLPDGWTKQTDADGNIFYANKKIDVVSWEHPTDAYYKDLIKTEKKEFKKENKSRCTIM